jgi:hypothetical protein
MLHIKVLYLLDRYCLISLNQQHPAVNLGCQDSSGNGIGEIQTCSDINMFCALGHEFFCQLQCGQITVIPIHPLRIRQLIKHTFTYSPRPTADNRIFYSQVCYGIFCGLWQVIGVCEQDGLPPHSCWQPVHPQSWCLQL